ncbi:aminotransferase class I/II-fold pyridoxal phosphate-dependent enzyme [Metasolibacillus sp.]|uniref:aminotransferase class I/II-fold pyridoxal phosphate-dependent enzyme n=1 Tax=Metasolibacillus sp. TaxID=2703680 RepID=UPI0025F27B5D|nr:aminotransferase class I/II-fold pyridoxal phosphate-dependent enzyme [Metasolibacillus sp.]MCT6925340.1 aminotransferase class I/II-fold pyridoxal phosphate-dependent enzyme [Metasolibacillus sp.]MCT6941632.1 aminotransferase class I/II-fold pyridoxal phosphate-dependent enzyme [Metasolibacillus sp.]
MIIEASSKMSLFTEAIFGKLKAFALQQQQNGQEIIDLSLGSPDIPPAPMLLENMAKLTANPQSYGYTLTGVKAFNDAVCRYYARVNDVLLDPETEVLQTMGSQEGLVHLPIAFCNPGDIILTTNPAYVAYDAGIHLAGATPYYMPLTKENGYLPDLASVPAEIAEKAKLLLLNLPGNPVPAMPSKQYFEEVVAFAKKYNIIVLHDAAYSEFYFTGDAPMSFLATPGAKDVGLEINSLSKSFSLAGARIAYIVGNAEMIRIVKQLKSNLDFGIFEPVQLTAALALDNAEEITASLRTTFAERHQILMNGLQQIGWEVAPSNGGMFVWAKYPYAMTSVDFAFKAIEQAGVVMVPGTVFGTAGEGYVRLALVQNSALLARAVEKLQTIK